MCIRDRPLNSALNPFLYTMNMVLEKQRLAQEQRIIKMLLAKATIGTTGTDKASSAERNTDG